MKILILTKFMYPQNTPRAFRADELARAFVRQGHAVQVVCDVRDYDYSAYSKETGVKVKIFKKDSTKFLFNRKYYLGKIANFGLNFLFKFPEIQYVREVNRVLKEENNYDLLITNAVPHGIHWGAATFFTKHPKVKKKLKWIAECGDPFMGNPTLTTAFYFKFVEDFTFRKADYVTVPVFNAKKAYSPKIQNKIRVIPQGYDFDRIKLSAYVFNPIITFIYAGSFHKIIRNPRSLISYLLSLSISFKLIIYTNEVSQELINDLVEQSDGRIVCRNLAPRLDLIKEMSAADFLLNLSNFNASSQVPSKLIDYTIAERPILNLSPSEIDSKKILEFLNRDYHRKLEIDISPYSIDVVSRQFLNL